MRRSTPKSVNYLIGEISSSQTLQLQAVTLAKLERSLKALLPTPLKTICRIANYRHHRLIIEVSNAAWLTRLRYEKESLTLALRQSGLPELSGIDFTINPDLSKQQDQETQKATLSLTNPRKLTIYSAELIENLAKDCKEGLKDTLIKLAQHAKKTNNNH